MTPSPPSEDGRSGRSHGVEHDPGADLRRALLYAGLIFALWTAYVALLYPWVQRVPPLVGALLNEIVRALIFVAPVGLLLRAAGTRRLAAALRFTPHVRRGVIWGLGAGALLLMVHTGIRLVQQGALPLSPVPVTALFTSLSTATLIEEVAFRGYLLQRLSGRAGFWGASAISAALFAAIHLPGWLLVGGLAVDVGLLRPLGEIFALGLALGYLLRRTGSLWASIVLHAAHNLASIVFYGPR